MRTSPAFEFRMMMLEINERYPSLDQDAIGEAILQTCHHHVPHEAGFLEGVAESLKGSFLLPPDGGESKDTLISRLSLRFPVMDTAALRRAAESAFVCVPAPAQTAERLAFAEECLDTGVFPAMDR